MENAKTLKYELTIEEVQYLLGLLDRVQIVGIQSAGSLLQMTNKLQNPLNSDDLQKEEYEKLKNKFEKPKK